MRYAAKSTRRPTFAHTNCLPNMNHGEPPVLMATIDDDESTIISPKTINIEDTAIKT